MAHERHTYICIDLKTFYASVECVDRGLDPLATNLVVADESRGRTTICLAITQAMKDLGIHNRCRLFEIPDGIDYITAVPRMQHYMEVSAQIYGIYLEYVSPQDVHVYSIDECFIDVTPYLDLYHTDAEGFACTLRDEVLARTGITATVGIGPNLFQAKVALDITAKHVPSRIGMLDDEIFRKEIWPHRPITDIWGIGPGMAARLEKYGVYDLMGVAALDETCFTTSSASMPNISSTTPLGASRQPSPISKPIARKQLRPPQDRCSRRAMPTSRPTPSCARWSMPPCWI